MKVTIIQVDGGEVTTIVGVVIGDDRDKINKVINADIEGTQWPFDIGPVFGEDYVNEQGATIFGVYDCDPSDIDSTEPIFTYILTEKEAE